jgi:hypothetical protein
MGTAAGGGPGAALGAAIGGATGAVGGVATTPPPPYGYSYGYPSYPGYYGYYGYYRIIIRATDVASCNVEVTLLIRPPSRRWPIF